MRHFALSAVGRDQPGIVAAVTEALLAHEVNIEDSQATILRGHFTMMLVVAVPGAADLDALRTDLEGVRASLGLEALALGEVERLDPGAEAVPTQIVTVYGSDHPGIVHAATGALAELGVDITDMSTRLAGEGGGGSPIYALMMEVAPPAGTGAADVESALARVAEEQGVEVTVRPLEQDTL